MRKSVVEYLAEHAAQTPENVAVVVKGEETTYKELYSLVRGYSAYLKENGVKKGDVVAVVTSQNLEHVVLYLAIHLSGGIIAPLERGVPDESIKGIIERIGVKFLIAKTEICDGVTVLDRDNIIETAKKYYSEDLQFEFPAEEDSADILFTTGTTGVSKGVEIQHKALTATAENASFGCKYKKDTVVIVPGPLNHASGLRKIVTTIINGSTIYILNGMTSVKRFFDALDYQKGTISCCLPPSAIRTIFQTTKDKIGEYANIIDFIESAGAPLPETDKDRLCRLLPNTRLYNNYGSSESASVCMYDYNKNRGLQNCIGKCMPNAEVIIVDEDGNEIKSSKDNMGFLACKGDINMKGYVNDPEATQNVLKNGAVHTNDIGYIDENGYVYIIGRKGDVINVGGMKVAPAEVESATLGFDWVEDCICIGVDDAIAGKSLKLLVVMAEGKELDQRQLRAFLSTKLEGYKVPTQYEQVDKVERTYNGKLNRKFYQ